MLTGVSLANNEFDEKCDDDFSFVSSSENCLRQRKTTRVPRRESGKAERPGVLRRRSGVVARKAANMRVI
jgi:hypothetical protein